MDDGRSEPDLKGCAVDVPAVLRGVGDEHDVGLAPTGYVLTARVEAESRLLGRWAMAACHRPNYHPFVARLGRRCRADDRAATSAALVRHARVLLLGRPRHRANAAGA